MARSNKHLAKGLAAVAATVIGMVGGFSYVAQDRGLETSDAAVSNVSALDYQGETPVYAQPISEDERASRATSQADGQSNETIGRANATPSD